MMDFFIEHTRIIVLIFVWGIALTNVFINNKNSEKASGKTRNIENYVGFAVIFTLYSFISKVIDEALKLLDLSLLNVLVYVLSVVMILIIVKYLLDIEDGILLLLFLPLALKITYDVMNKTVVSLISNNTTLVIFLLSILLQSIVGFGLLMYYKIFIYTRR
jgi:hypothetical protein